MPCVSTTALARLGSSVTSNALQVASEMVRVVAFPFFSTLGGLRKSQDVV